MHFPPLNLLLQAAIGASTEELVDLIHGYGMSAQHVAVLRVGMNGDWLEEEDDPMFHWSELCGVVDDLEKALSKESVLHFGATITCKAQVAHIMYSLVDEALASVHQRLRASCGPSWSDSGILQTLVEHAGGFILLYGADRYLQAHCSPSQTECCSMFTKWLQAGGRTRCNHQA
jgi:hypothetical protein